MDMNGSAKFKSVPIIDVTKENVAVVKPLIRGGIIGADFIAIDCVSIYGLAWTHLFQIRSTLFEGYTQAQCSSQSYVIKSAP